MRPMHLSLFVLLVVAGVVGYEVYYSSAIEAVRKEADSIRERGAIVGRKRPDFRLKDLDGLPREIGEWDGHPLIVNFWASWCLPCRREIPAFIELQKRYGPEGLRFIGIAVDERPAVRTYAEGLGIEFNYPVLVGTEEAIEVARDYGNEAGILPYTVAIDRSGRIVQVQFGEFPLKDIEALIESLIGDGRSRP